MWDLSYIQASNTREAIKGLLLSAEEQNKPEIARIARLALENGPRSEEWTRAEKLVNDEFWGDEDDTDEDEPDDYSNGIPYGDSDDEYERSGEYNTGPVPRYDYGTDEPEGDEDDDEAFN